MASVQTLAIRLLADLGHVDVDGVEPGSLGSRKGRSLLWLLALGRGRPVAVDHLVEALWGDAAPERPADQVAVLVSRLRAVVGRERIEHGDGGYRLHYDWLDVDELESLAQEAARRLDDGNPSGAAAAARVALSLARLSPGDSGLGGSWVASKVLELDRTLARARRTCADAFLQAGAWMEAADAAIDALAADPYDEQALRTAMRAQAAAGRDGAALALFARVRGRLVDELGADPSAETLDLHAALLRGELASRPTVTEGTSHALVGREAELARLDLAAARAAESEVAIVAVTGEAGIGKTSLVRAWTSRRGSTDVVLFATCGEFGRSSPLDPLLGILSEHLRAADDGRVASVLGAEQPLLGPLLGLSPASAFEPLLADGVVGPTLLHSALTSAVARLAPAGAVVLVLDDAHRAGPALAEWLQYVRQRRLRLVVVMTARAPATPPVVPTDEIRLGPFDLGQTEALVGPERAASLYARSGGHPLFLSELALADSDDHLPASLVDVVSARCDALGPAGETLRSAAVVGNRVDPDLLAAVLNRPAVSILDDAELGVRHQLLVDDGGVFVFRHALVREALAAAAGAGRSAWLHRQVARVLARRTEADPAVVADHARRGGDVELAARALRSLAARAAERFDHATAETLLDESLSLVPDPEGWLERARVRTRRGHYLQAYDDVELARPTGARALEVGAWASYFDRSFDQAISFATDGAALAEDAPTRARCRTVAGRTRHAVGDLWEAQTLLEEGIDGSSGADRLIASAWLGVLRSHQSRAGEALVLLRPATRPETRAEHTSAILHALLFTGHAHAIAGRPALALDSFERHDEEAARRDVERFQGRGPNFSGWVLRNVGALSEGVERHLEAFEISDRLPSPESRVASLEDLAEAALGRGDADEAARLLDDAAASLVGDLVFGWRLRFKLELLRARTELATERPEHALTLAHALATEAARLDVPRYAGPARLVAHAARAALGERVDLDAVQSDLDVVAGAVALEAWWWIGESAALHRVPAWVDRAAGLVDSLAEQSAERGDTLRHVGAVSLDRWAAAAGG